MRTTILAMAPLSALLLTACDEAGTAAAPVYSFTTDAELRAVLVEIDRTCQEQYEAAIAGLAVSGIAIGGPAASIGKLAARSAAQERREACRAEYDRVRALGAEMGLTADPRRA